MKPLAWMVPLLACTRTRSYAYAFTCSLTHRLTSRSLSRSCLSMSTKSNEAANATEAGRANRKAAKVMQDALRRVRQVNYMPADIKSSLLEFKVDGTLLGLLRPKMAKLLCSMQGKTTGHVFAVANDSNDKSPFLTLTPACGTTYESRTKAVAEITLQLKEDGIVTGWRDELFPVTSSFYELPVFAMERAAVPFLGALEYGVHVIGIVAAKDESDNRSMKMWMARRAADKSKYPGMLDHIAAGGQPVGLSLTENVVKECYEEAGIRIPEDVATECLRPAGAVSYERYAPKKDVVERVVLFCYDLYLPPDFHPKPVDGEVEEFFLFGIDELMDSMALDCHDELKPNCYTVIINFLVQHGLLSPEVPGYLDVLRELRGGVCR